MTYDVYLAHHGILGMKWGVRRYQNADGSYTAAGRMRYGVDDKSSKSISTSNGKTSKTSSSSSSTTGKKITREQKFVNKYLEEGMSREDALLAARKRVRMEKILAVTAGVTVAALAVYAGKKMWDTRVDKFIPKGMLLQNISRHSDKGIDDAFYAAFKEKDKLKYRGLYANQLLYTKPGSSVFSTKIKANDRLKVASQNSVIKTLRTLIKDSTYKDSLEKHLTDISDMLPRETQQSTVRKAIDALKKGKVNKNVYEAVNISLTGRMTPNYEKVSGGLYDALKSNGYDAIMDINDRKYSGYMASKSIIVFGGNKKLSISGREKLSVDEIEQDLAKAGDVMQKQIRGVLAKAGAVSVSLLSAPPAAVIGAHSAQKYTQKHNEIVSDYIKAHPATKLTYDEILANYYGHK